MTTEREPQPLEDSAHRYLCCHVVTGPKVIAIFGLLIAAVRLMTAIIAGRGAFMIVAALFDIAIYVLLWVAIIKYKSKWYLPYLVVNGINVAIELVMLLLLGALSLLLHFKYSEKSPEHDNWQVQAVFFIVVLIIDTLINVWFMHIVYRAYTYVKTNEKLYMKVHANDVNV